MRCMGMNENLERMPCQELNSRRNTGSGSARNAALHAGTYGADEETTCESAFIQSMKENRWKFLSQTCATHGRNANETVCDQG